MTSPGNREDAVSLKKPNIVLMFLEETRSLGMHWPAGHVEEYLPNLSRMMKNGITFSNGYCASSQCGPSRAILLTGAYENVNGVQTVVSYTEGGRLRPAAEVPNLATMMTAAGYDAVYKGKWDLNGDWEARQFRGESTEPLIQEMEETYGFSGWNPPDTAITNGYPLEKPPEPYALATLGAGTPNNDERYVRGADPDKVASSIADNGTGYQTLGYGESVIDYLGKVGREPAAERKPFFLVVGLNAPHDVCFYPNGYDSEGGGYPAIVDRGISLPSNHDDDLKNKPVIQSAYRQMLEFSKFTDEQRCSGFVNFYAYLHEILDANVGAVLDALDKNGLTENTIIVATSDHGEQAMSHGLVQKSYNVYRETVNVPVIFSNPVMFPEPRQTDAVFGAVDVAATIAELAGAEQIGVGRSQAAVLKDPSTSVRDGAVYVFDDLFGAPLTSQASHIRALLKQRHTYAVYFTAEFAGQVGRSPITVKPPYQVELYDKQADPGELTNLLWNADNSASALWAKLHEELTASMTEMGSLPAGWPKTVDELKGGIQHELDLRQFAPKPPSSS